VNAIRGCHLFRFGTVRTLSGSAEVESNERLDGQWQMFNLEVDGAHRYYVSESAVLVHNGSGTGLGPNGGQRNESDQARMDRQQDLYRQRREDQSREAADQNPTGYNPDRVRARQEANKGPQGVRPEGPGGVNRERNIGIDDEHSRVAKGSGGGQGAH
jgi:hypothetical protein